MKKTLEEIERELQDTKDILNILVFKTDNSLKKVKELLKTIDEEEKIRDNELREMAELYNNWET